MEAGDPDAPLGECIDLGQPIALQHRMPTAAVGEEKDGVGVVEGGRIGRPAAGVGGRHELRPFCPCFEGSVEAFLGEHRARPMLVLARAVARLARQQNQLLPAIRQLQSLEVDVFELHLHRRAGVQLQGEDALGRPLTHLLVDRLRHQLAVDEVLELRPARDDPQVVPFALLDLLLEIFGLSDRLAHGLGAVGGDRHPFATLGQDAAAFLLVEDARIGRARLEVALIAAHDGVAEILAAVLDAAVAAGDSILQLQFKVIKVALPPDQERVAFGGLFGRRLTDDRTVLHRPELGLPLPAFERRAVEDRHESGIVGGDSRRTTRKGHRGHKHHEGSGPNPAGTSQQIHDHDTVLQKNDGRCDSRVAESPDGKPKA